MLDLEAIAAFSRIAKLGSISAAARALKMPKSSVSRLLMRLEESLEVQLIERSTRHLRLTDAGLLMQQHAQRLLDDVNEAENAIGGLVGIPRGDLRVTVPFTFAAGPLASMLPGFTREYPEVRVVLSIDDNRTIDLQLEKIDAAIRVGPLKDSELITRRLISFRIWPCASPEYLSKHPPVVCPSDLHCHTLLAHADHRETWAFRSASGDVNDIRVNPGYVVPEAHVMKAMLIAGIGIGRLPDFHAEELLKDGRLVRVLPDWEGLSVDAHVIYPSHRSLSAKVLVFVDALVRHLAPASIASSSSNSWVHQNNGDLSALGS
jgi:DNA-binding transcriptional LysR family regulator